MDTTPLFTKEKAPIITTYLKARKDLNNTVASKGFYAKPGFAYALMTDIEIDTKLQLSALNYKLLEQAITQELKQAGLDYGIAYKNAEIAWELDKQALLTAWDRELAVAKKAMADDEEVLKVLAIEVGRRAIDLMEAKTAIELEAEGYRLQMEELDGTTGGYEIQLAQAKLRSARKRLELIPYIERIIDIEREIVGVEELLVNKEGTITSIISSIADKELLIAGKEQEIAGKEQEIIVEETALMEVNRRLISERQSLIEPQHTLIATEMEASLARESLVRPALESLIEKMTDYVSELAVQLDLYRQIADAKSDTADIKEQIADKQDTIIEKQQDLSEAVNVLMGLSEALADYKNETIGPAINSLVTTLQTYRNVIPTQIGLRVKTAMVRNEITALAAQEVAGQTALALAETLLDRLRADLDMSEITLDQTRAQNQLSEAKTAEANFNQYSTHWSKVETQIQTERDNTSNMVINFTTNEQAQKQNTRYATASTITTAETTSTQQVSYAEANMHEELAEIQVEASKVTAILNHILS